MRRAQRRRREAGGVRTQPPRAFGHVASRADFHYLRLYRLHRTAAFFITRAKRDMNALRVFTAPRTTARTAFAFATTIWSSYAASAAKTPKYGKTLTFLTNNMSLTATTIAAL